VLEIVTSNVFDAWLSGLRDRQARVRIIARIERLGLANPGDVKPVGAWIFEMRLNYGPGYRVYYQRHGEVLIVLLAGGEKSTQAADIAKAKEIAAQWVRVRP
jgi:putative addiction module killer protein